MELHIGKRILQVLKEKERSVAWLARKISYDDANLGRLLRSNKHIHSELLLRITKVLRYDFFAYYSDFLRENNEVD